MKLKEMLSELIARNGSDLHLTAGQPPVFRIDGALIRHDSPPLDEPTLNTLLLDALSPETRQQVEELHQDVEVSLRHEERLFRFHIFRERGRLGATLRPAPQKVPVIDDLYPQQRFRMLLQDLIKRPRGLIIVTGPSGSGKTTCVAAMLETMNQTMARRIITIEDPIAYEMVSKQSLVTQRAVGQDVRSFENGAYWAFHEDLDVIFLGELRTLDAVQYAFALAESGHLVFSCLHVESASEAVNRLIEVFPEPRDLIRRMAARNLVAVLAQRLVPCADRPGRIAVNEALVVTPRICQMIIEGRTDLTLAIEASRDLGMQTMDDAIMEAYHAGLISYETAWTHIQDREHLRPVQQVDAENAV